MTEQNWDDLGIDLNEEVGTSSEAYVPSSQYPPPPPIGTYTFRGVGDDYTWGRSTDGALYLRGKVELVSSDAEVDGRRADIFISSRVSPFRQDGTDLDDFVRGCGDKPSNGSRFTVKEIVDIVAVTWQQQRKGYLTWEGYCKECRKTIARGKTGAKKEDKFGFKALGFAGEDGSLNPNVVCPLCGEIVTARGKIQKFYAA